MPKKQVAPAVATGTEVVEDLHVAVAEDGVEFTDVTGKDDLPPGVVDEDEVVTPPAKPAKAKPVVKADDELPEALKGKTPAQLAKMYSDAQELIGRQGTELGDLRRVADKYITSHLTRPAPAIPAAVVVAPKPLDDVDFFTNPAAAIARAISEHPALKELQGTARTYAERELTRGQRDAAREFNAAHPDSVEVLADEAFRDWVVKSPIRQQMLLRAHKQYDLASANELFSTWKELKALRAGQASAVEVKPAAKSAGKPAAAAAAARVPTGGNATPSANAGAPKIYRRADLIRLQQENPARYELMGDEITLAYTEGRVR